MKLKLDIYLKNCEELSFIMIILPQVYLYFISFNFVLLIRLEKFEIKKIEINKKILYPLTIRISIFN